MAIQPGSLKSLPTYRLVEEPRLEFEALRIGLWVPTRYPFALQKTDKGFKLHFQHDDLSGARPILSFLFQTSDQIPSCETLSKWIVANRKHRVRVYQGLTFLRTKKSFGESMLHAEDGFFALSQTHQDVQKSLTKYRELLRAVKPSVMPRTHEELKAALNLVRQKVYDFGLSNYCRSQASMGHFFIERCANCSAQTKLLLSLYTDLGFETFDGWQFGAELFTDHVRPVLFHPGQKTVIDLVYNKISTQMPNPILTPEGLLRKTLQNIEKVRPGSFFPWEEVTFKDSAIYSYLPGSNAVVAAFQEFFGLVPEPKTVPYFQSLEHGSREATLFDGPATNAFSSGEVPETADLSAYRNQDYSEGEAAPSNPRLSKGLPKVYAHDLLIRLNEKNISRLNENEQRHYTRILNEKNLIEMDVRNYAYSLAVENLKCRQYDQDDIMNPIAFEVDSSVKTDEDFTYRYDIDAKMEIIQVASASLSDSMNRAPLARRHKWVLDTAKKKMQHYVDKELPQILNLLHSENPARYWSENEGALTLAVESNVHRAFQLNLLNWLSGNNCVDEELFSELAPTAGLRRYDLGGAYARFYELVETKHREVLRQIDALPAAKIVSFLGGIHKLFKSYKQMVFLSPGLARDLKEKNLEPEDLRRGLNVLLQKMLFDRDYLYSTKLNDQEKESLRELGTPTLIKDNAVDLPDFSGPVKCIPGEFVAVGFLFVECAEKKAETQLLTYRQVVEQQPEILIMLMRAAGPRILSPDMALLIFNGWRQAHTQTRKTLSDSLGWQTTATEDLKNAKVYMATAKASSKTLDPDGAINIFEDYLDALLATNFPFIEKDEIPTDYLFEDKRFHIHFLAQLSTESDTPGWIKDDPLFKSAWEYYSRFRPKHLRKTLLAADTSRNFATIPGGPTSEWFAVFGSTQSGKTRFEINVIGEFESPNVRGLGYGRDYFFLVNILKYEGQFYFAPPVSLNGNY